MALKIGDKAPEILGISQDGKEIKLSDYSGRKLILYFYPKDNTSGCTAEACSLRDNYAELRAKGYEVVGVSVDSRQSHTNINERHQLPYDLVAYTQNTLPEQFGTWGEKSMYGRKYMGMLRTTFIIDEQGVIEKIFTPRDIKTATHGSQILGL